MITMLAVFAVLDTSVKQSSAVAGRVNATQRARLAMDTITRQLRSQICISATAPAIISGTENSVKFHVDLTDKTRPVEQRELVFDRTDGADAHPAHVGGRRGGDRHDHLAG